MPQDGKNSWFLYHKGRRVCWIYINLLARKLKAVRKSALTKITPAKKWCVALKIDLGMFISQIAVAKCRCRACD